MGKIADIQGILGTSKDDKWGINTQVALDELIWGPLPKATLPPLPGVHHVTATSFADPPDLAGFAKCKRGGFTDMYCYNFGDNGVGYWHDNTKQGSGPSCALPPEDIIATWGSLTNGHLKSVKVIIKGVELIVLVKDTLPHKDAGKVIDLNPDAVLLLKQKWPLEISATWEAYNA